MLRDRNVTLVVLARFVSRVGGEAAFFIGIWGKAAFEFDASAGQIAVLMGTLGISAIAGSALAGVLVDRFDPRRVLIVAELFFVPIALAMILVETFTQLVFVTGLLGLASAPVFTAIAAFGPYLTDDDLYLERVNSWIESAGLAAFVAGPALGALIVRYASLDWVFVADALTSVIAVGLVLPVGVRELKRAQRSNAWKELREGFSFSYRSRPLRYLLLMATFLWFSFGSFAVLEPLFFRDVLGVDIEALGWVNTLLGLGLVAGALALPRLPAAVSSMLGVAVLMALSGVGVLIYTGTASIVVVAIGGVVWGLVIGVLSPLERTLLQWNSPEAVVGRVTGAFQVHTHGGELLPLLFVPALAAQFGVQGVLIGTGVMVVIVSLASIPAARSIDRTAPAGRPEPEHLQVSDEPISPVG